MENNNITPSGGLIPGGSFGGEKSPNPVFLKFHNMTREMMPYDNIVIMARTRSETTGMGYRKYYEAFARKKMLMEKSKDFLYIKFMQMIKG